MLADGSTAAPWYGACIERAARAPSGVRTMSDSAFDAEQYMKNAAAAIGLSIAPEHRAGVIANLERLATVARLVTEFSLPEDGEAAPVFRP
jgi:1-carboxybiuret hydrolase subunit AtzG-like protein